MYLRYLVGSGEQEGHSGPREQPGQGAKAGTSLTVLGERKPFKVDGINKPKCSSG